MESYRWFLLLSAALWAAFVGVWWWWISGRLRRRRRLREWPRAAGVITKRWAKRETHTIQNQTTSYVVHHGDWELVDPHGRTRRGTYQTTKRRLSVGDEVEVMYDPDDVTLNEPVDMVTPVGTALFFLVFLSLSGLALPGVITLFLGLGYD